MIAWVIEEEFGVQYHPGHVRKLLHGWGFSVQRPRRDYPASSWGIRGSRRKPIMELHTIGIDLGKTGFHLVGLNRRGEVAAAQEVLADATVALHSEPESRFDWHGSLWGSTFSRTRIARTRPCCRADASSICKAVGEDEQERLYRCGSRRVAIDAVCADQDRRPVGHAVSASSARALGDAPHGGR